MKIDNFEYLGLEYVYQYSTRYVSFQVNELTSGEPTPCNRIPAYSCPFPEQDCNLVRGRESGSEGSREQM